MPIAKSIDKLHRDKREGRSWKDEKKRKWWKDNWFNVTIIIFYTSIIGWGLFL